jgi:modulator of FtsH protease HflC
MSIVDTLTRHPVYAAVGALALAVVASMTLYVVDETEQAIVLRYGQIQRVENAFRANQPFGATDAGLKLRIPFIEQLQRIDKRVLSVQLDGQPVLSTDQLRVQVDAYARYRIVDPRRMYETIRTEDALSAQISNLLASSLRNELGKRTFASLLSPERGQVMQSIQTSLAEEARNYGVQVIDVRINRADLPEASRESVFNRMRTAREQEAETIKADGQRQAQIIRADAEAEAARIYAESFGKDPQFYAFYRAMQSYEQTFRGANSGETTFVLPPGEGYLSQMNPAAR